MRTLAFAITSLAIFILIAGGLFIFLAPPKAPPAPPAFDPSALSWSVVASSSPWEARDSAAAFVFDSKMWIAGGIDGNGVPTSPDHAVEYWKAPYFNDIWNTTDGVQWRRVTASAEWAPRRSMSIVDFDGSLWMFGGWSPQGGYQSDVWQSKDGVHWTRVVAKAAFIPREGQWVEVFKGKLWMTGGVNYDIRMIFNDVWYTEDGITWTQAPVAPWPARWDHATAVYDGKLWMTGGMDLGAHKDSSFDDEWVTEDGITWTRVYEHAPWPARQGHQLVPYHGYLWLMGRLDDDIGGGTNDVWYSKDGISWTKGVDPLWTGREDFWTLVFKNRLWVFSGMDHDWRWTNDVWATTPVPAVRAPVLHKDVEPLALSAKAYLSIYVDPNGTETVLASEDADTPLPLASVTKLITALVAMETYPPSEIDADLRAMLVASENEPADALANKIGTEAFVQKMNAEARSLRLTTMRFVNPSGLDPKPAGTLGNVASASDLADLLDSIYRTKPELFAMLGQQEFGLLKNTNELLAGAPLKVLGGKTGETPHALQNLVIITESPTEGYIVSVVMGSTDRARDMWKLLNYVTLSFDW